MDAILYLFSASVGLVGFAVLANRLRKSHALDFDLKANCLMTRWPIVFVTGSRSLFYFSRYFNLYPVFLAEHGYEVFTVYLPWRNPKHRQSRFREFVQHKEKTASKFHLFLDGPTREEFSDQIANTSLFASLTELANEGKKSRELRPLYYFPFESLEFSGRPKASLWMRLAYSLHGQFVAKKNLPNLNTLGAVSETAIENSLKLLERTQVLGEMDLRSSDPI